MKKNIVITLVVIVLGVLSYFIYAESKKPGKYDEFAQCIEQKGAKFYGAFWCPHCQEQKALFGKSAKKLPYLECALYKSEETELKAKILKEYESGTYVGPYKKELDDMKAKGFLDKWTPSRTEICAEASIESYPTWVYKDGTRATGEQSLQTLSEKTTCQLPQ